MRRLVVAAVTLVVSFALTACEPSGRPIMGDSRLTADQLTAWFHAHKSKKPCLKKGKKVRDITAMFVNEGATEGVNGDIAFAQAVLETGFFTYGGVVRCRYNNYGGLGGDGVNSPATFPFPRMGVRAQIQHLRRYADPTAKKKNLHKPLVDPRFTFVARGSAPTWQSLSGKWAANPNYGKEIVKLYKDMRAFSGL